MPLQKILTIFCEDPDSYTIEPLGGGNINDTYLVYSASSLFVLQRINGDVFPDPRVVIENFHLITGHLGLKRDIHGHQLQVAAPILTLAGGLFYHDKSGGFWRGQTYIPHMSCKRLARPGQVRRLGAILAAFHFLVRDLDMNDLVDPLPGFHNLPLYLEDFDRQVVNLQCTTDKRIMYCLATIDRYRKRAATLENAKATGILSCQPIHGDPKVDNFLFNDRGEAIGLLDLDTAAVGLVHYDLGDCLRSCCNRAGETGGGNKHIAFDMEFCQAFCEGYFPNSDEMFTKKQREYIFDALLLVCFELGLRFFTDHLCGNIYFKVRRDGENLMRAIKQFQLADDIARKESAIKGLIRSVGHHNAK